MQAYLHAATTARALRRAGKVEKQHILALGASRGAEIRNKVSGLGSVFQACGTRCHSVPLMQASSEVWKSPEVLPPRLGEPQGLNC